VGYPRTGDEPSLETLLLMGDSMRVMKAGVVTADLENRPIQAKLPAKPGDPSSAA